MTIRRSIMLLVALLTLLGGVVFVKTAIRPDEALGPQDVRTTQTGSVIPGDVLDVGLDIHALPRNSPPRRRVPWRGFGHRFDRAVRLSTARKQDRDLDRDLPALYPESVRRIDLPDVVMRSTRTEEWQLIAAIRAKKIGLHEIDGVRLRYEVDGRKRSQDFRFRIRVRVVDCAQPAVQTKFPCVPLNLSPFAKEGEE